MERGREGKEKGGEGGRREGMNPFIEGDKGEREEGKERDGESTTEHGMAYPDTVAHSKLAMIYSRFSTLLTLWQVSEGTSLRAFSENTHPQLRRNANLVREWEEEETSPLVRNYKYMCEMRSFSRDPPSHLGRH